MGAWTWWVQPKTGALQMPCKCKCKWYNPYVCRIWIFFFLVLPKKAIKNNSLSLLQEAEMPLGKQASLDRPWSQLNQLKFGLNAPKSPQKIKLYGMLTSLYLETDLQLCILEATYIIIFSLFFFFPFPSLFSKLTSETLDNANWVSLHSDRK